MQKFLAKENNNGDVCFFKYAILAPLELRCQKLSNSILYLARDNYKLVLAIFVCGLCAYGYELTHGTFTLDEEIHWDKSNNALAWQGKLGRWSLYLYSEIIFPGLYFPFTSCLFSVFFLSVAYSYWLTFAKSNSYWGKILFGCLAISFPTFGHMLSFSFMSAQVSFSAALMIYAYTVIAYSKNKIIKYIISTIIITFSIMTYQSLIFILIALFCVDNHDDLLSKCSLKKFITLIIISICSVASYFILDFMIKLSTSTESASYLREQFRWFNKDVKIIINELYIHLTYLVKGGSYTFSTFIYTTIPAISILINMSKKINALLFIAIMYLYTFSIFIVFGGEMPARTCFYVPIIYAGFYYISYIKSGSIGKIIISVVGIYVFIMNCSINTNNSIADTFARERDKIIANRIVDNIYDSYPNYIKLAKHVVFCGKYHSPSDLGQGYGSKLDPVIRYDPHELFGLSYFSLPSEENGRIRHFLQWLGVDMPWLELQNKKECIMHTEEFKKMPSYPEKGFVKIIDDTLVVKFSDE